MALEGVTHDVGEVVASTVRVLPVVVDCNSDSHPPFMICVDQDMVGFVFGVVLSA
jgi:hypothetical protein